MVKLNRTIPARKSKLTESELEILRVVWEQGASTVREVHEALNADNDKGYTTTLKMMQIMAEKGILARDESSRTHIYHACEGREKTQRRLVGDMIDRVFGGSGAGLIMQALSSRSASPEELAEIRRMLDAVEPTAGNQGKTGDAHAAGEPPQGKGRS